MWGDVIVSECLPCGYEEWFDTQDEAIEDAENHVAQFHRKTPSNVRGIEKIGHVQARTVDHTPPTVPTVPRQTSAGTTRADEALVGASSAAAGTTELHDITSLVPAVEPTQE